MKGDSIVTVPVKTMEEDLRGWGHQAGAGARHGGFCGQGDKAWISEGGGVKRASGDQGDGTREDFGKTLKISSLPSSMCLWPHLSTALTAWSSEAPSSGRRLEFSAP